MDALHSSLALLFAELTDGPAPDAAYMLNGGDPGLIRSLDGLSAEAASKRIGSGNCVHRGPCRPRLLRPRPHEPLERRGAEPVEHR